MAFSRRFKRAAKDVGLEHGWRSGLEEKVCETLKARGVRYEYETFRIPFLPILKTRHYTPDVTLLDNFIVVELKGRFVTADRQKHLAVKQQYPDLDLRFVFSNANARISKTSKTTYAMWCQSHGFLYGDKGVIPEAWLKEPVNPRSRAVVLQLKGAK